ncbi:MAG: putative sugar O-methyltransferase [Lentisphaerae bacterium]|nr:putative sugar O-methyltransferase [Lentisphaerota bacterium]
MANLIRSIKKLRWKADCIRLRLAPSTTTFTVIVVDQPLKYFAIKHCKRRGQEMPSLKKTCSQLLHDKIYYKNILHDPNFDLSKVDQGMADRFESRGADHLPRIITAYNNAKEKQAGMSSAYQVGNEWLPIFNKYLYEVAEVLKQADQQKLADIYNNFMRDDCSIGLHGLSFSMKRDFFSGKISKYNKRKFMCDIIHRMQMWKQIYGTKIALEELESPNLGNPYGIVLDGLFIRTGSFYNHHYSQHIGRLLRRNSTARKTVLEIGAGYGGMAYYLCRDVDNLTYVALDLPENMALTAYYLMTAFPDKKVFLHGEQEIDESTLKKFDIVLISNTDIEKLPSNFFNVTFNSYSLAEMSQETINLYIQQIMRVCNQYFLHVNHNKNSETIADHFGIDESRFNLLYQTPALWNFGRNIHMDEYEYLYQKIPT